MRTRPQPQTISDGEERVPQRVQGQQNERVEPSTSVADRSEKAANAREQPASQTAVVRVAYDLADSELEALRRVLEKRFGGPLAMVVEKDPNVLGGVWVRMGDIILDGSLHGRLEILRHHLREQNRALVLGRPQTRVSEKEP